MPVLAVLPVQSVEFVIPMVQNAVGTVVKHYKGGCTVGLRIFLFYQVDYFNTKSFC